MGRRWYIVNGTGGLPLGKNHLADLLGTEAGGDDHDKRVEDSRSWQAVVAAGLTVVAVEFGLRGAGFPALASVVAAVGAGVGAGLVAGGTGSDAVTGLLSGYLVTLAVVVLSTVLGVGLPGLAAVDDALFNWFTHLVVSPLAVVFAVATAAGVAAVVDRGFV